MKYALQHLRSAASLIGQYNGSVPFAVFLKQFFSDNKKYGSKDRKRIAHLCYCYYRLGHALEKWTVEERLRVALFLCNDTAEDWSVLFDENWISNWKPSLQI